MINEPNPTDHSLYGMALREKAAFIFIVRLFLTLGILIAIIGFAGLGGFLNRCRGGFINFGEFLDYWPAHILSRQIFSFSTGLLVVSSEITDSKKLLYY